MQGLGEYAATPPNTHYGCCDGTFDLVFEIKRLRLDTHCGRSAGPWWVATPVFAGELSPQRTQHLERIQWLNHCNIDLHIPPIGCLSQCPNLDSVLDDRQIAKPGMLDEHEWADVECGSDDHGR